ncbi:MAG TPA: zinc ribbon domain-containing protein [Dehalococcoidia bacterium]
MPLYEYYCRTCGTKFELLRPMSRAEEPAACPQGHPGAERTVSLFAAVTRGGTPEPAGGGCACGGAGCACSA